MSGLLLQLQSNFAFSFETPNYSKILKILLIDFSSYISIIIYVQQTELLIV